MKKEYIRPSIEVLGSFESLTQGGSNGTVLDATFPVGTPFSELTFS